MELNKQIEEAINETKRRIDLLSAAHIQLLQTQELIKKANYEPAPNQEAVETTVQSKNSAGMSSFWASKSPAERSRIMKKRRAKALAKRLTGA